MRSSSDGSSPTSGDTTDFSNPTAEFPPGAEHFIDTMQKAENAGLEYILIPVQTLCWEAWVASAFLVAKTQRIKALVAARPGYIQPSLLAKMISTFDQLSGGRISINLIAGASDKEARADGITLEKHERYEVIEETVSLMKRLWTEDKPLDFSGKWVNVTGARCEPRCHQSPHPKFYLGGGSKHAWELSAKHSDVHLFWGDRPERIAEQVQQIRELASAHGREDEIGFGMRLQIICRETEEEAWRAAWALIEGTSDKWRAMIKDLWKASEANRRMKELAELPDFKLAPHLWSGLTTVRPGAGVAVVGTPEQVAQTLQEFVDAGCHSFCLSGYPHHDEAVRFGEQIRPLLVSST